MSRASRVGTLALVLASAACVDVGGAMPDAGAPPDAARWGDGAGLTLDVAIVSLRFDPVELTVPRGTTLRWTNYDAVPHTVTEGSPGAPGVPVFDSPLLSAGDSFQWTFEEPGEWIYYCRTHPNVMRDSRVRVQ